MDMQKYNDKMDSIHVRQFTVEELMNGQIRKKKRHVSFSVVATGAVLLFIMTFLIPSLSQHNTFIISVYADDGTTMVLSDQPARYQVDTAIKYAGNTSGETKAHINLGLNFNIQGANIDKIKISCSEDEIKRNNIHNADIYFVEYLTLKNGEFDWISFEKNETFISSMSDDKETFITMLVGNSYEMEYEQQNIGRYGLMISGTVNEDSLYSINEKLLTLQLWYNDGSVVEKKVRISATDDVFEGIDIGLVS